MSQFTLTPESLPVTNIKPLAILRIFFYLAKSDYRLLVTYSTIKVI